MAGASATTSTSAAPVGAAVQIVQGLCYVYHIFVIPFQLALVHSEKVEFSASYAMGYVADGIVTLSLFFIYFPDKGGMLVPAGKLPYDPQILKPPADYRGADQINVAGPAKVGNGNTTPESSESSGRTHVV